MATFSLGSGVTPGAPGVYINEQAGRAANAGLADFSTVYMLVETDDNVPVTVFPFNTPTPITSLADYKELIRIGNTTIPDERIPLLSYNCVNEFFQNAQVGDLRVVRVGTPNQIVEIEFLPSATKINSTSLPSALMAGNVVFVQMTINGVKLVSGDGSTGYTAAGEWLGVPVEIPVNYVAGDEANNRKISAAISLAVSEAIESNPAVRSSVYVRDVGMVNDLDPSSNSQNSYVTIAATTFDGNVSVVTEVFPVGSNFVFMQNAYDIQNIVGGTVAIDRVPQDYTQCIATAFDGQQDQGYLVTPTAYAQFDAAGRALVGAAAAAHCESNNFKWMALADPGPFLVTDVNKYQEYVPHQAAADLVSGLKYLVNNVIYEWIGADVSYNKLTNQTIVFGQSAETAVKESANLVADSVRVGMLDAGQYTINAVPTANIGIFELSSNQYWPVTLPVQQVTLTGASGTNDFALLNNSEVYVVAPPYSTTVDSEYSLNYVFLAANAVDASNVYNAVMLAGGTSNIVALPVGAISIAVPSGDTALLTYADSYWDLPVDINGQTSDLIENISGANAGVNTLHLPSTLQDPTESYVLNWISRTIYNPSLVVSSYAGTVVTPGSAVFNVTSHGLRSGQVISFTQPITVTVGGVTSNIVTATTKLVSRPYWVKSLSTNTFVVATSLANYSSNSFITLPVGTVPAADISVFPSIFYSRVLGRGITSVSPVEVLTLPTVRARKYEFDSSSIFNAAANSSVVLGAGVNDPGASIFLNNSSVILGEDQITPYGENLSGPNQCDWLPELNLVNPVPNPTSVVTNAYCVPTVDQFFQPEAYLVPAIQAILGGTYDGTLGSGTIAPATTLTVNAPGAPTLGPGVYNNVPVGGGSGTGLTATVTIAGGVVTLATVNSGGQGYTTADTSLSLPSGYGGATVDVTGINNATSGSVSSTATATPYALQAGVLAGMSGTQLNTAIRSRLVGVYFNVTVAGTAPDGSAPVIVGDRVALTYNGSTYNWVVIPADVAGGDLTSVGQPCYGSQVELVFTPEQTPPANLWRFDAITSTEVIDDGLRGIGFNGVPQAAFVEAGVDNVNRLFDDSQRYFNPLGFIAYYGPWIENGAGQYIPPSPYVTGVALRRYRAEGYQFPPAGVKYQLADAVSAQIPINSSQQNLLNPKGCNAVRTLPGYPQTSVFIWGGRTRVNEADAQQRLYQFVNTRVIMNVVYGSLRTAFDSQIFNVIDGFGVVFNQITTVGNSVLNQLYVRGALFGSRPSDAFQVICDGRVNTAADLESGLVNAKVFVTPVPTLERIQIDLIRVAVGQMQKELGILGLS